MNARQLIGSIRLKYDIKREYFTVAIPVTLALLLVIGAYMSGHTLSMLTSPPSPGQLAAEEKIKNYQEYQKALQAAEGNSNYAGGTTTTTETTPVAPMLDLDHYLIYAALVAMTPYSVDRFLQRREKKRNEEDFTQFLFKMSELMRAGIDPIKSVIELSRSELGSLNKHIALAASAMVIGNSFDEGMRRVSKSLDSELITKYIDLIVQASNMGGSVHNLILKASEDMRAMIMLDREMEGNLQQYVFIFYLGQIILIVTAYILSTSLFPQLLGTSSSSLFGDMSNLHYQQGFFHMLIINAMIGGIIIGKICEGSAKDGLKHSVVLIVISYVACLMLILPTSVTQDSITAVSGGGQLGLIKMPLGEPIQFHLQDAGGNPKPNAMVYFSSDPYSKLLPASSLTDAHGNVTVSVTLGTTPGMYTISAKENNDTVASVHVWGVVTMPTKSSGGD
jgi:flagellar protein FlaJ